MTTPKKAKATAPRKKKEAPITTPGAIKPGMYVRFLTFKADEGYYGTTLSLDGEYKILLKKNNTLQLEFVDEDGTVSSVITSVGQLKEELGTRFEVYVDKKPPPPPSFCIGDVFEFLHIDPDQTKVPLHMGMEVTRVLDGGHRAALRDNSSSKTFVARKEMLEPMLRKVT